MFPITRFFLTRAVLACILLGAAQNSLQAALIDFETVPGGVSSDKLLISTQYQAAFGVSFSLQGGGNPLLAQVGPPQTAFQGPLPGDRSDKPAPGVDAGQFFLTDDDIVGGPPSALLIDYTTTVSAASGIILDIDGDEEWTITAFDTLFSPIGGDIVLGPGAGDGGATPWSFSFGSDQIKRISIDYTGGISTTGLAFDNFNTDTAFVPEPGIFALFGLGLFGIGIARRRHIF